MSKIENILDGWKNYLVPMQSGTLEEAKLIAEIWATGPLAKYGKHA